MGRASATMRDASPEAVSSRLGELARFAILAVALCASPLNLAFADFVSPFGGETAANFADIRVQEDRVSIALEIDLNDFPLFVEGGRDDPRSMSERTGKTLRVTVDGAAIEPVARLVDVRDRKPRISAAGQVKIAGRREPSKQVVFAQLDYPFASLPSTITIAPPMNVDGMPAASIGMMVQHKGVPITDYRYLSIPETLQLDWEDPWFSAFENPNLTRHHKSPLMSFISIEPRVIRHEVIFRLRDLEGWIDLQLGESKEITKVEMGRVKRRAAAFFARRNALTVDGVVLTPSDAQVSELSVDVSGLRIVEDAQTTDRSTALLGVILSYPQDKLPSELMMKWDLFPGGLQFIPVTITDPAGGLPGRITADEPIANWTNYLKQWVEPETKAVPDERPLLAAILASFGIGETNPNAKQATNVMAAMLDNIGVALLETRQTQLADLLDPFVATERKDAVAAEIERGLLIKLPSGARGRIDSTRDLQVEEISSADKGTRILASWTAEVSGDHWGHLHRRSIRYRGLFELQIRNGCWYLGDLTILAAKDEQV